MFIDNELKAFSLTGQLELKRTFSLAAITSFENFILMTRKARVLEEKFSRKPLEAEKEKKNQFSTIVDFQ